MQRQTVSLPKDVFDRLSALPEGERGEALRKRMAEYLEGKVEVEVEKEVCKQFGFYADAEMLERVKAKAKAEGMTFTKVAVELLKHLH